MNEDLVYNPKKHHPTHPAKYQLRSILGYDQAVFHILIGSRGLGKTFSIQDYLLYRWANYGEPFTYIRLTTISTQKMMANNAEKLIDPKLKRWYDLDLRTNGMNVYDISRDPEKKYPMCRVIALSEMAKEKGVAMFDADYEGQRNVFIDEFMREPGERALFDITYNMIGALENIIRDQVNKAKIFMACNLLEECSDVLANFNFIPEVFGIYYLRNKRAVIHYAPPGKEYLASRKGTISDMLAGDQSNFSNVLDIDRRLLYKGQLVKPMAVIKFGKSKDEWFTIWNSRVIVKYNKEQGLPAIAMRPYIDEVFNAMLRDDVIVRFDMRSFLYRDLITQKRFQKSIEQVKPRGA